MKREIVDEYWDILDVILKLNDHPEKEYDQIMPSNMDQLEEKLRDPESSKKLGNLLKYIALEYQKHPEIVRRNCAWQYGWKPDSGKENICRCRR